MHVVVFEGVGWPQFAPLSLSRPVFELLSGSTSLLEKQIRCLSPTRLTLWVRPGLIEYCQRHVLPRLKVQTDVNQPLGDGPAMLVSARWLPAGPLECGTESGAMEDGDEVVALANVREPGLGPEDALRATPRWTLLNKLPKLAPQGRVARFLWDLIGWNQEVLAEDARRLGAAAPLPAGAFHVVRPENIWLSASAKLQPGCVLDASAGAIIIADHALIGANAVLQGPCYVGPHSAVMPLALVRPGVSLGPTCKAGGEISNTIVQGFSNKSHEGFVGDSYLGEWVNLGAGTTTSNLKNTYGPVSVKIGANSISTGRTFLGSLIGDHTKTAILTRLMTGTYVGYCCMLSTTASAPAFVPSFSFLTDRAREVYEIEKAVEMMKRVFSRRQRQWSDVDDRALRFVKVSAGQVESI